MSCILLASIQTIMLYPVNSVYFLAIRLLLGLVTLRLHILQPQLLFLLLRAVIVRLRNLGIRRRRVNEGLDEAAGEGIGKDDGEGLAAADGRVKAGKEGVPLGLIVNLVGVAALEDLAVQVVADLREETFHGGEATAESARVDLELQLGALEGTGLALQDVAREVGGVGDREADDFALLGDLAARLDVVGAVAAVIADGGHDDDLLEVRDLDHLHVRGAGVHAAGARGGEAVDLVGDDLAVGGESRVVERGVGGPAVAEAEGGVLLGGAQELVLLPLADAVLEVRGDEGVAGGIVDVDAEGERVAGEHGAGLGDDLGDLGVDLGHLLLARLLAHLEVLDGGCKQALDVGELAAAGGDLEVELDELDGRGVGLDDLTAEVGERRQSQLVVCALRLDSAGGLDLVVLGAAVLA